MIPDAVKDLNPWARLRVVVAGVAANAALCLLVGLLVLAGLPSWAVTLPEPSGAAVLRSIPPGSPLASALRPGDSIAALQDVLIVDGAGEVVALLKEHLEATRARSAGLLKAAASGGLEGGRGEQLHDQGLLSLKALNATVARLVGEARLSRLEEAGLLSPEAFCTHLDLMEGEDEEEGGQQQQQQQAPSCCSFDALVGQSSSATTTDASTSCFAYLPPHTAGVGAADGEQLRLTCLPARELALHSHVVGVQKASRGDRGRPFCFRHVSVPPNVLVKVMTAGEGLGGGRATRGEMWTGGGCFERVLASTHRDRSPSAAAAPSCLRGG